MLEITIPERELWDETNEVFIYTKGATIKLEHSLVSIEKFEEKHHIHFLDNENLTNEQMLDYIKCMTITQNVNPDVYNYLTEDNLKDIRDYMNDSHTATKIIDSSKPKVNNKFITCELIYYYMISLNIPMECRKWHINKLLTLIRVCSIENQPPKKMSQSDVLAQHRAAHARRRRPKK